MEHHFMVFTGIWLRYERAFHQAPLRKRVVGKSLWQISNCLECCSLKAYLHWSTISRFHLWVTFRVCTWMPSSQDDSSTFGLSICFQRSHVSSILWSYRPFKFETGNDLEIHRGKRCSFLAFPLLPWVYSLIPVVWWFARFSTWPLSFATVKCLY